MNFRKLFRFSPPASEGRGRYCFQWCLSVQRGIPHLHPMIGPLVPYPFWGGPPSHNTSTGPISFLRGNRNPGGGGDPNSRPGVPQSQLEGTPSQYGGGYDRTCTLQTNEYLLRSRRYDSCVHAGGLSFLELRKALLAKPEVYLLL